MFCRSIIPKTGNYYVVFWEFGRFGLIQSLNSIFNWEVYVFGTLLGSYLLQQQNCDSVKQNNIVAEIL